MFKNNQKIVELEKNTKELLRRIDKITEGLTKVWDTFNEQNNKVDNAIIQHTNIVEARLLQFHKEITDKYFSTLERILKVHSETSLITALAHQVNQKDLTNLRSTLLRPFLEEKWRQDEISQGEKTEENIKSLGQKLVIMRRQLHEEILKNEREEKPTAELKGKIEMLNLIMGDTL